MKKVFNSLFVIIAAMVTFAGCSKQEMDATATSETKTVQFFAESIETKTAFGTPDGTTYPTLWTANDEKVAVALNGTSKDAEVAEVAEDGKTASFETTFTDDGSGAYQFFALSPASAKNNINATVISANIWSAQTPSVNSVDENAMVLYAVSDQYTEFPTSVSVNFKHFTAYGKLSFKNLNLNGAEVSSVSISSSANIAGRWNYIVATNEYAVNSGNNTITLTTDATENLWFACAPVGTMNGQTLKFTINTSNGPLSKEITLTGDKYKFESGHIANIVVDMAGIEFAKSDVYTLVTDISQLTVGSKVIIAASNYAAAMSTTQNKNNRAEAGQSKKDNTIVDPADNVEILEVETGASTGTFALRATKEEGYIYAAGGTGSNNHLKTKAQKDNVSSWTITIAENGEATLKCADATVARNTLMYNDSNKIFSCYASGQKAVSIYKLQGSGTVLENYLSVSTTSIEVDADAESTSFTVSSDLDWTATSADATVNVSENTVNVEFEANTTNEPKTYTVTVSAEGVESKTVTITQKGVVKQSTIADVINSANDSEVETEGLVVAKNTRGVLISDETGVIYVYKGDETGVNIGDLVSVAGKKSVYSSWPQIGSPTITVISSNNQVTYPNVDVVDGAALDNLLSKTAVSYIQYTGTLTVNGSYYNVTVEGAATAIGSVQYPLDIFGLSNMNGKKIKVTGYHVGVSSSKYINTMATAVEVVETVEPEPEPEPEPAPEPEPEPEPGEGGETSDVPSTSPCYVLSENFSTGSNNSYAGNCDITVGGITWNLTGNSTMNPWRMGGKDLNKADRALYSKTAYQSALSKVEFISGTASGVTWNSLTLVYSTSEDFSNAETIVTTEVGASKTISFEPEGGFPKKCFFKFILNVTIGGNNKFVQVSDVKFYGYQN